MGDGNFATENLKRAIDTHELRTAISNIECVLPGAGIAQKKYPQVALNTSGRIFMKLQHNDGPTRYDYLAGMMVLGRVPPSAMKELIDSKRTVVYPFNTIFSITPEEYVEKMSIKPEHRSMNNAITTHLGFLGYSALIKPITEETAEYITKQMSVLKSSEVGPLLLSDKHLDALLNVSELNAAAMYVTSMGMKPQIIMCLLECGAIGLEALQQANADVDVGEETFMSMDPQLKMCLLECGTANLKQLQQANADLGDYGMAYDMYNIAEVADKIPKKETGALLPLFNIPLNVLEQAYFSQWNLITSGHGMTFIDKMIEFCTKSRSIILFHPIVTDEVKEFHAVYKQYVFKYKTMFKYMKVLDLPGCERLQISNFPNLYAASIFWFKKTLLPDQAARYKVAPVRITLYERELKVMATTPIGDSSDRKGRSISRSSPDDHYSSDSDHDRRCRRSRGRREKRTYRHRRHERSRTRASTPRATPH